MGGPWYKRYVQRRSKEVAGKRADIGRFDGRIRRA